MSKYLISAIPTVVVLIVSIFHIEVLTPSKFFGVLAYSIAIGSVIFFTLFAPFGRLAGQKIFGIQNYYLGGPKSVIPTKVAIAIVSCIVVSAVIGMLLYHFGY